MLNKKEKPASDQTGGLLKYYKSNFSIPKSFPQDHNLWPLGYLMEKIVEGLSDRGLGNLRRRQND